MSLIQSHSLPNLDVPLKKEHVNFRISEDGKAVLYYLQDYFGLSQSGVIELLLREKAREISFTLPSQQPKKSRRPQS